jgi:hypothetical protein
MTAEERRKASGPLIYWAAAAPAHRGAATVGAPFGAPPPSLGSKDIASRPFEASFLASVKEYPDAIRIVGTQFRVVIAGLAAVTRGCVAV